MRGAGRGRVGSAARSLPAGRCVAILAAAAVLGAVSGCGPAELDPTAVPTFPMPAQQGGPASGVVDDGRVVPDDCGRVLAAPDLEAVLGLPLGSVGMRTTIGLPAPSVGRTERVTCSYFRTGGAKETLLTANFTAYADPAAAEKQWQTNANAESGARRDMPLGGAKAALFEKDDEAVLMVAYATSNASLILPNQPLPSGRNRSDMLIDIALRMLPAIVVEPTAGAPGAVPQAGAAR